MSVEIEQYPSGHYRVSRLFQSLPAAMRATAALLPITEAAFAVPETNGFKPGPAIDPPEHAPPPILEVIEAREADTPEDMGLNAEAAYRCANGARVGD